MQRSIRTGIFVVMLALATFVAACSTAAAAGPHAEHFSMSDPDAFPGKHRQGAELAQIRAGMLRTAKATGVTHVRIWVWWGLIDGCNAAQRDRRMNELLTSIQQVRAAGLEPMLSFAGVAATDWGKRENANECSGLHRDRPTGLNPSVSDYSWFVYYVADKVLRDPYNVRIFETYNEPDHPTFLCVLPETLPHKRTHRPVKARFITGTTGGSAGQVAGNVPSAQYDLGYKKKDGSRIVTKTCGDYQLSLGVKRFRELHNVAVQTLENTARRLGMTDPTRDLTILTGDVSGGGYQFLKYALRHPRKLHSVDGVAVHSYLRNPRRSTLTGHLRYNSINESTGLLASKCRPTREKKVKAANGAYRDSKGVRYNVVERPDENYIGMECLWRVHALLHQRARYLENSIWITEAGLIPFYQDEGIKPGTIPISDDPRNIKLALDRMHDAPGVRMINWYDITLTRNGDVSLPARQTWLNGEDNIDGNPPAPGETSKSSTMRDWAAAHGYAVPAEWPPLEPLA
jgi:hypothetical protein